MRDDIKKLNMYAANVFSTILAQNPTAIAAPNRDRFITKSFEIARGMMQLEDRKTTLAADIPDEGGNDVTWWAQEKLIGDIEKNLGLKAEDADPFTLTGRLAAINRALTDGRKSPRVWKVDAEKRVNDKITGWLNEGFKSYPMNNGDEVKRRLSFEHSDRWAEEAEKMARVIRDIGREAWKDEENFPQPVSFTAEVAREVGKTTARVVNWGGYDNPDHVCRSSKYALVTGLGYVCPSREGYRRLQNIVDIAYPVCSNDEG